MLQPCEICGFWSDKVASTEEGFNCCPDCIEAAGLHAKAVPNKNEEEATDEARS